MQAPAILSPVDYSSISDVFDEDTLSVHTQLKFVQIGLWEARRRWYAGQTQDLDVILAHLDEDIQRLKLALEA